MPLSPSIQFGPVTGEFDLAEMYDLAAAYPEAALHLADLPWRFRSPAYSQPERTRLWRTAAGELLAWAAVSSAWRCIDDVVRPGPHADELASAILAWAVEQHQIEAEAAGEPVPFYATCHGDDPDRIALIERHGFTRSDWSYLHLGRDLATPIPEPSLAAGFKIRPLDGEREIEAYVAMHRTAFGSTHMTAEWRRATLNDPRYVPELDLVAVAPDGTLAGFCVGWITPPLPALGGTRRAQVEPMGVQPGFRRLGLGRALLHECSRRARALGADRIDVDCVSGNAPAVGSYQSAGFQPFYEEPFFWREFTKNGP